MSRNNVFRILVASPTGRMYYYFAKDEKGWYQVTSAGNQHRATADQVLNHILPVLADPKSGITISVEHPG